MTVSPRPAPVVRVSDPRAPSAPPYLASLPEAAPVGPAARRGPALPLVLLLVGLAVGAGAAELRHAQRDRAREAAAASVLDLRLESAGDYGAMTEGGSGDVVLRRDLAVRNVGGRSVKVLAAELVGGPMTSRGSSRVLDHGDSWQAAMAGPVTCPGGSPPYAPDGSVLRVRAETGAGERTTDLPVPPPLLQELQSTADRACGLIPAEEAVQAEPADFTVGEDSASVDVQVYLRSSAPVDLLRAESGYPGLRVAVRSGGRPPVFPFRLAQGGTWPRLDGEQLESSALQVVVTVEDCGPLRDPGPGDVPIGVGSLLRLALLVGGEGRELGTEVYDPGVVQQLVDRVC